jgi:subtilisin family serine protease
MAMSNGRSWVDNLIKPDLVAPGNRLLTLMATDNSGALAGRNILALTYPALADVVGSAQTQGRTLMYLSGSSVATPAAAGAAAVLLQANPGLTPPLVKAILQYTAQVLPQGGVLDQGAGLLNLEGAVRLAQALRTDLADAVRGGKIKAGDSMLAAGASMPTQSSTLAGQSVPWGRIVTVGGSQIVSGDVLFKKWQPVYDPTLIWARHIVTRATIEYYPAGGKVPADAVPRSIVELAVPASQSLIGANVRLLGTGIQTPTTLAGGQGLFTPLTQFAKQAKSGGLRLQTGFSRDAKRLTADDAVPQRRVHPERRVHPQRGLHPE